MIIDLSTQQFTAADCYDLVVIGGGIAAMTMANELSKQTGGNINILIALPSKSKTVLPKKARPTMAP